MRPGMVLLGIGLGILWIVALNSHATPWLTWVDFCAACLSILAVLAPDDQLGALRAGPFVLGGALAVLWIVALAAATEPWLAWWTFAFGIGYVVFGVAMSLGEPTTRRITTRPRPI